MSIVNNLHKSIVNYMLHGIRKENIILRMNKFTLDKLMNELGNQFDDNTKNPALLKKVTNELKSLSNKDLQLVESIVKRLQKR